MLHYLKKIYSLCFPYICIFCHLPTGRSEDLCPSCEQDLPHLSAGCLRCGKPSHSSVFTCGNCLRYPPPFDTLSSLYIYQKPITQLVMNLKFHHRLQNARLLGEKLAFAIKTQWYYNKSLPDVIIPVPLHRNRLIKRGFNQALEIARPVGRLLDLPIDTQNCQRIKHTAAQAQLTGKTRAKNVKNAFQVQPIFEGKHLAVIDDVVTTGQTITAFCQALRTAGARQIDAWCCARAVMHSTHS